MDIEKYLTQALDQAIIALSSGNYPIGSVLVSESGEILASSHNQNKSKNDISAHAEILCLRDAGLDKIDKDLVSKSYLFTTLEPCFGCSFFIDRTNVKKIIWSLTDPHKGGISKLKDDKTFANFFQDMEFIAEPNEDMKKESQKLMANYFLSKNRPEIAKLYL